MAARTKARKRAVDVLFEADQRGVAPLDVLRDRIAQPGTEAALPQYSVDLVEGVLWNDEVPDAVAVDEAVELARSLSTDDSPTFVNGLLGRVVQLKPTLLD